MKKIITTLVLFLLPAVAGAATLSVSPSSQTVNVGDIFSVIVNLDTQGASIDGVDLRYLNYNPSLLQIQATQITPGTLMPMTLANSINTSLGRITFSQISAGGNKYKGSGTLATISFKALAVGSANLNFNFTLNNTTDSNVASGGSDILTAVVNGSYTINNSTGASGSGGSSSGGGGVSTGGSSSTPTTSTNITSTPTCTSGSSTISLSTKLSRGSKGVDVTDLQNFLISKGYLATDNNTGFFGMVTEASVKSFQRDQNIVSSGSPLSTGYGATGPKTRAVINSLATTFSCTTGDTSIEALKAQIKVLQAMVNELLLKLQNMPR